MKDDRRKQSVLVVDDDPDFTDVMREILTRLSYIPVICSSSRDALSLVSFGPGMFDAAIVDAVMPEMTGPELAIELVRIKDDMPVVLVTGYGHLIPTDQVRRAGFRAVLTKPVLREEIHEVLCKVLEAP